MITYYTDGSCKGNPGSGGFGCVGINENGEVDMCVASSSFLTTNNREELKAILYILENYGYPGTTPPTVYSDSSYAVNTFNTWMYNWANNGWIKSDKKVPENLDIIQEYYNLIDLGYNINLNHIRGHKGILGNEIADKLATGTWDCAYVGEHFGTEKLKNNLKYLN